MTNLDTTVGDVHLSDTSPYMGGTQKPSKDTITPVMALVVTQCKGARTGHLLTRHTFAKDGRTLGAGVPVDASAAVDILSSIGGCGDAVWVNDTMLAVSPTSFMWHVPPAVRPMLWRIDGKPVRMMVPYPGLVMAVTASGLRIYAYKGKGRPTAGTKLFHAPLPNIFDSGYMCWGNIEEPLRVPSKLKGFEDAVLNTAGSHANHNNAIKVGDKSAKETIFPFYADLNRKRAKSFPEKVMVAVNLTPGELI